MNYDVIIIGAGGAGMMCAIHAGRRGRKVLLLDHSERIGGKILISGGGRCNFTNLGASPKNYVSQNPHFCKSALSRYPAEEFIQMVEAHAIPYHEKKLGQLFCDQSAQAIVDLLKAECADAQAEFMLGRQIVRVTRRRDKDRGFSVELKTRDAPAAESPDDRVSTVSEFITCESLVIATGGLSIPKIGASGFGYGIARQYGLKVVETAAALDGFTLGPQEARAFADLAGISIDCVMESGGVAFRENLLFTHAGLSGPVALQASLHWQPGTDVTVDLLPETDSFRWFMDRKKAGDRSIVRNLLGELLPARFVERFCAEHLPDADGRALPLPQVSEKVLAAFCQKLHAWTLVPSGTVGYSKAEVTRGGVDTDELSSKTMEARKVPGLFFIGEVVDVTGWLGGYNFQWAWASGWAAAQVV